MPEDRDTGVWLDATWIERCWGSGGVPEAGADTDDGEDAPEDE